MTTADMPVRMWCWPGPRAAAGAHVGANGEPVLTVFVDPVNLVLTVPPFPSGPMAMARFLRELARAASHVAAEIDPHLDEHRSGAHRAVEAGPGGVEASTW